MTNYWIEIPVPRVTLAEAGFGQASIPADPHVTVAYFGALKVEVAEDLRANFLELPAMGDAFKATINGVGEFLGVAHVPVALVDSFELNVLRTRILSSSSGFKIDRHHGFQPHVRLEALQRIRRAATWTVDTVLLCAKEKGQPAQREAITLAVAK